MENLVERLIDKEEQALIELMQLFGDYLFRTAYLLVKDEHAAEEAVQDTFVTAFHKINQLGEPEKLKSWLTTIIVNRCRSNLRKKSWKHIFFNLEKVETVIEDPAANNPEDVILELDQNEKLSDAIQALDYKYREVITLFYFNELKILEIANVTNTNVNTVKSRLLRGKAILKAILMKGEEEYATGTGETKTSFR